MIKVAVIGIAAVLLALPFKNGKSEYSTMITLAACLLIFVIALAKISDMVEVIRRLETYMQGGNAYVTILMKMLGITFVSEFASGMCQDAGYGAIAGQVELMGKLVVLVVSLPVLLSLLDTINTFFSM